MKKNIVLAILLVIGLTSFGTFALSKGGPSRKPAINLNDLPREELSQKETEGLLLMREEEKLARDVYSALYEKWNLRTFNNISRSEQRHTSRVKDLLDKYGIDDPVVSLKPGEFKNPEFQNLFDQLVAKGSISLTDALKVGAEIEDLDIKDLKDLLEVTDNQDIRLVYGNLIRGSRNHMRSFNRQLQRQGISYSAKYISQQELNDILSSSMERGNSQVARRSKR